MISLTHSQVWSLYLVFALCFKRWEDVTLFQCQGTNDSVVDMGRKHILEFGTLIQSCGLVNSNGDFIFQSQQKKYLETSETTRLLIASLQKEKCDGSNELMKKKNLGSANSLLNMGVSLNVCFLVYKMIFLDNFLCPFYT